MKKIPNLLFALVVLVAFNINAQDEKNPKRKSSQLAKKWSLRLGFNTVDSNGDGLGNPIDNFFKLEEEAYHGFPLKLDLEYRFTNLFSLEASVSRNRFLAGKSNIDGNIITADQDYFAADFHGKMYYDELFKRLFDVDWLELYLQGGAGYFKINEGGFSANVGTGANIWLTERFGLNASATAKWAIDTDPALYDTNHTQFSLGISYRFGKEDSDNENDGDSDNDGVADDKDNCPYKAGTIKNNGCPEELKAVVICDTDNDGVLDSFDKCPDIYGEISNYGCPVVDTDGDGVIDSLDNCPNVAGGPDSKNGCPIEKSIDLAEKKYTSIETLNLLTNQIKFKSGNYNFTQDTYPILIAIVELMSKKLDIKYKLIGHTDSKGSFKDNRILSKVRANAVRNYLVDSGIRLENLQTLGLGESDPVDSNLTPEGRAKNRRVEIIEIIEIMEIIE
jgi:OOP family OmpA-OmpF porin